MINDTILEISSYQDYDKKKRRVLESDSILRNWSIISIDEKDINIKLDFQIPELVDVKNIVHLFSFSRIQ